MKSLRVIALILVGTLLMSASAPQDSKNTGARLKALYLYNFSKYFNWPDNRKQGDFVFGIMGNPAIYAQMATMYSTKKVGSQQVKIANVISTDKVGECNIIFVASSEKGKLSEIAAKAKEKNILVVSEASGALSSGGVVNFFVQDSKIAFEISKSNAKKYGLTIGADIIKFAARVL